MANHPRSYTGSQNEEVVDPAVVAQLAEITDVEGGSVLGELVGVFVSTSVSRLALIEQALARSDMAEVARDSHALAGSAGSLGGRRLAHLCRRLRVAAMGGDIQLAGRLSREVEHEFARVRDVLVAEAAARRRTAAKASP